MITELIFASNNQHKVEELRNIVGERFRVITLKEAGIHIDIPEPFDSLEANASQKSRVINELTGKSCFSEDTGLEVAALGGEPGVKTARYAGDEQDTAKNIRKLLLMMEGQENRTARFRTVISLRLHNREWLFEGICEGYIGLLPKGLNGFGYDSVFTPLGSDRTFAEMTLEQKAQFSHRKRASDKLVLFLQHSES
jgi:XTP/dITP diphosphohydrolase